MKIKRVYLVLVKFILMLCGSVVLSAEPNLSYCKAVYGGDADLTFEPIEANSSGVVDNFISQKSIVIKEKDAPEPTGFMCQIVLDNNAKKKCPKGMHVDTKRLENAICITKKISLRELCPNEIAEVWPEIKDKICKKNKN